MAAAVDHREIVRRHFDQSVEYWRDLYEKVTKVNDYVLRERKDIAIEFLMKYVRQGGFVLDVGCGAGVTALEMARNGFKVRGFDLSEKMIVACGELARKAGMSEDMLTFSCGDFLEVEIADGSVDAVLALGFLEYVEDEIGMLGKLNQALRPGGILIVSGLAKYSVCTYFRLGFFVSTIYMKTKMALSPRFRERVKGIEPKQIHSYTVARFRNLLCAGGFEMVEHRKHGFANFMFVNELFGSRGDCTLHRLFTGLARIVPVGALGNDIVVAGRKDRAGSRWE